MIVFANQEVKENFTLDKINQLNYGILWDFGLDFPLILR
jgi:hypothetical protein